MDPYLFCYRDSQCIIWMQGHPKTVWDSLFGFRIPLVCLATGIAIKFQIHKNFVSKKDLNLRPYSLKVSHLPPSQV